MHKVSYEFLIKPKELVGCHQTLYSRVQDYGSKTCAHWHYLCWYQCVSSAIMEGVYCVQGNLLKVSNIVIRCLGNGIVLTCAHRSASIFSCGKQYMHEEFRVRTLCELVLHQDYYLQPHIVSHLDATGTISCKNILPATSASFDKASQLSTQLNISLAKCCFQEDCSHLWLCGHVHVQWLMINIFGYLTTLFHVFNISCETVP